MSGELIWILAAGIAWGSVLSARRLIHYFQLESYQFPGFFRSITRNLLRALLPGVVMTAASGVLMYIFTHLYPTAAGISVWIIALAYAVGMILGGLWWNALEKKTALKKDLKFTPRIKRLYGTAAVVFFLLAMVLAHFLNASLSLVLFPLFLPIWVAAAGLIAWPVEKLISELYFRDAQRILNQVPGLIRIGITGSYGKTTVKVILGTLLAEKYQTLVTRASFNTPMGITREIRESLQPTHQVFVAEMGARHVGDIKELVRLVHPTIGVISSVGPQHLETFHTLDRIKRTKYELIEGLPENGVAFFPDDNGICFTYYQQTRREKILAALDQFHGPDVWAENIQEDTTGSSFDLCTKAERITCHTKLWGRHNIQNIVLAASVALHLGVSMTAVRRGIEKLQPVEHRLQTTTYGNGITIIDDAFNSNPQGAEAALQVLKKFTGKRYIVTPGMVELGKEEETLNHKFGHSMASCADVAVLVGKKRTMPIQRGLLEAGFNAGNMHVVDSLDQARKVVGQLVKSGDVVLFENDLPDQYSEK